ncbi:MAG TPA: MMPL family transporter [Bacteroidia bacterium]|nr:MMPL family transporter [Bacteroidia bacterium]
MNRTKAKLVFGSIVLITLLCLYPLRNLRFEFDIRNFFPANDPDLAFFEQFNQKFHAEVDEDYIFIALTNKQGIFRQNFLQRADSLAKYMSWLDHVQAVYCITNLTYYISKDGMLLEKPIINIRHPEYYREDSVKLYQSEEIRKTQVSADGKSLLVSAFTVGQLSSGEKDDLLRSIDQKVKSLHFDESHVAAKIRVEKTYIAETERNLKIYLILSFLIIAITLYILFRSWRDILLPFAVILVSLIWTLAIIGLVNYPLDIISSLLPPILAIVCMSDIIHVTIRYKEELQAGFPKEEALRRTFKDIGLAIFFTSLTTAAGFFSLCITNILPVRMFGFFTGFGVMFEFVITLGLMWSVYLVLPEPRAIKLRTLNWQGFLRTCVRLLFLYRRAVMITAAGLILASLYFISRIEINRSLLKEIPRNNPILEDYTFFEKQFSGTRSFELELKLPSGKQSFYQLEVLKQLQELETFAEDSLGIGLVFSPLAFIKSANKIFMGGDQGNFCLPENQEKLDYCVKYIFLSPFAEQFKRYITTNGREARLSGKLPDLNSKQYALISTSLKRYVVIHQPEMLFACKETGSSLLFDKVSYSLIRNMFQGIAIGFVLISLIGIVLFRSMRMALIVFLPNAFPLLLLGGLMGALGIWLKEDTSIIFSIALGLAVDNTIHFVSRFRIELAKGKSGAYAVKSTYLGIGKAMILTTLVLFGGFMCLLFSSFGGTFYIGLLVSACLVFALAADMSITPLLLLLYHRKSHAHPIEQNAQA